MLCLPFHGMFNRLLSAAGQGGMIMSDKVHLSGPPADTANTSRTAVACFPTICVCTVINSRMLSAAIRLVRIQSDDLELAKG